MFTDIKEDILEKFAHETGISMDDIESYLGEEAKEGDILAKHFIKKGKKLSSDDLCYLSSKTGDITDINTDPFSSFFNSLPSPVSTTTSDNIYNTNFDIEINDIVGQYAKEDIVQYQSINNSLLETIDVIHIRERKKELKNRQAKIEATKKIIEQKRQENLANKNATNTNTTVDDIIKNELDNNIWA